MRREFQERLNASEAAVATARRSGDKRAIADALKDLGDIQRRPPWLREDANRTYSEAAEIYAELGEPLEQAWVIRHIGINHEYAERLVGAEECYDRSLKLFRQYADEDSLNYANTVRYPAVIKNRLGKRAESKELWLEALDRYSQLKMPVAVAEASAWLAIFAIEEGDRAGAEEWLEKAQHAAAAANDPDTNKWVEEAKLKVKT